MFSFGLLHMKTGQWWSTSKNLHSAPPTVIADRDEWQERVEGIRAVSMPWC